MPPDRLFVSFDFIPSYSVDCSLDRRLRNSIGKVANELWNYAYIHLPTKNTFPLYILQVYKSSNFEILKSWKSLPKTQRRKRRVNWSQDNINLGDPRRGCGGWKGVGPRPSSFTGVVNFENPILFARPFAGEFFKTNLNLPPGCKRWIISFMGRAHRPSAIRHRPVTRVSLTIRRRRIP